MSADKLQSLTEIFNQKFFRIPDFQRGYSWQKPQLEAFWGDLDDLTEDRVHYTGVLTVKAIKNVDEIDSWLVKDKKFEAFYVIDGQQRLTTSIILINEILNELVEKEHILPEKKLKWQEKFLFKKYNEYSISYIFGYESDDPSNEFFKTEILKQESSSKIDKRDTLYTSNLANAKEFFKEKLEGLDKDKLRTILIKLSEKFKFNFSKVNDEFDIHVMFETMNNRGKPLSNLELLKNRLIYLSTFLSDENGRNFLKKEINDRWKTIYEYLGKDKDNPMDDDDFLYHHWIMYFQYNRNEASAYAKYLLGKHFTAKKIRDGELSFNDIHKYIRSLSQSVEYWFYLYNPKSSNYSDDIQKWIEKLNRLGMRAFAPLLIVIMIKYSNNEFDKEQFIKLLKSVERFNFLIFNISRKASNTKNTYFYKLANQYYFSKDNIKTIDNIIDEVDKLINSELSLGGFYNFIEEKFKNSEGFYKWDGLKYFLFEYELELQKEHNKEKVIWEEFNKKKKEESIEHIYPQNPKDGEWEAMSKYNEVERGYLLNTLGNLLLLKRSKNSSLQNKCFSLKKKDPKDENGFYNGSNSEIEVDQYEDWTPVELLERGKKMLEFLEKRWNIKFEDHDKLLKLDFLNKKSEDKKN
ncbi:hypothetical protein A6B43_01330 [Vespertiliibacter pulmonis]|uniref:Uncharacterized protein DUF1524 n=1 Tax=Vespertiliibacter pulmonis TaxID=1443036 RepID=A0A3N4W9N7_9PAST|nr:DUF262 domain-containing protein [Vespertiliibacter pulmonis]QLB20276.1 hypothetical protein A6B43_01330 [Vespertiliibacter pulmonis]RPE86257.1 uncharacterized protein DUF1524 [Vespertiliibacter pulmonis]